MQVKRSCGTSKLLGRVFGFSESPKMYKSLRQKHQINKTMCPLPQVPNDILTLLHTRHSALKAQQRWDQNRYAKEILGSYRQPAVGDSHGHSSRQPSFVTESGNRYRAEGTAADLQQQIGEDGRQMLLELSDRKAAPIPTWTIGFTIKILLFFSSR